MDFQFSLNLFTLCVFLSILIPLIKGWNRSKRINEIHKLPPGPRKLPFIGNLHNLIDPLTHRAFRDLARKHGPLMHLQLGEISAIVASSPRMAKEIMRAHDLAFADRPEILALKIITYNRLDFAFNSYGEYWKQMRKICVQELLSHKNVQSFCSIRRDEFSCLISSIQLQIGKPINLTEMILSSTSSIISRAAFGKVCRNHYEFAHLIKRIMSFAGGFSVADLFPSYKILPALSGTKHKLLKIHQKLDAIMDNIINEHIENIANNKSENGEFGQEDLIDVLLRIKTSGDLPIPITNDNIKAVILDMFSGGTQSSSSTVIWAMSEMMRNPNIMAKAQKEIRQAVKGKRTVEENDIEGFSYLKLVVKETLRFHPPGPFLVPRECRQNCEIDGYKISIGTKVFVNVWAIGRDPEYWQNPESFIPERFKDNPIDFTGNHFEFLPFGAGRRMCPGMSFGLPNIELPLALLLYHFNWELPNGFKPNDLDMSESPGLAAGRKNDLQLVASVFDPLLDMAGSPVGD